MADQFTFYARDEMLGALPSTVYLSAHTAAPGDDGSNEVGTTGVYSRQAVTLGAASSGVRAATNEPQLDIDADVIVTDMGLWDAASGGNFIGDYHLTASKTDSGDFTLTAKTVTLNLNLTS